MVLIFEPNDVQDVQDTHELHYLLKIDLCIEFFLTLIGNGLCLAVMNYEQFGGDPMKRGIENKLISSVCIAQILGMFSSATISLIRALYGPVNIIITIGNVQLYFISLQFSTLGGVANFNQNICHLKVTPVSPFCDEL